VLVDLPAVAEAADGTLRAAGVRERCEIVGADFFTDALPAADAYVLPRILHDWDDDRAGAILRNCRRSLCHDGRLLLAESVVADGPEPDFRKLFDLHMLVLIGGKERTGAEWRDAASRRRVRGAPAARRADRGRSGLVRRTSHAAVALQTRRALPRELANRPRTEITHPTRRASGTRSQVPRRGVTRRQDRWLLRPR
jgi:hypothetical protein